MAIETKDFEVFPGVSVNKRIENLTNLGWKVIAENEEQTLNSDSVAHSTILTAIRDTNMNNYARLCEIEDEISSLERDLTPILYDEKTNHKKTDDIYGQLAFILMGILYLSGIMIVIGFAIMMFVVTNTFIHNQMTYFSLGLGMLIIGVIGLVVDRIFAHRLDRDEVKYISSTKEGIIFTINKLYAEAKGLNSF